MHTNEILSGWLFLHAFQACVLNNCWHRLKPWYCRKKNIYHCAWSKRHINDWATLKTGHTLTNLLSYRLNWMLIKHLFLSSFHCGLLETCWQIIFFFFCFISWLNRKLWTTLAKRTRNLLCHRVTMCGNENVFIGQSFEYGWKVFDSLFMVISTYRYR